jgi:hypothetical protein
MRTATKSVSKRGGEVAAPAAEQKARPRKQRKTSARPLTFDDPLFKLIGSARSRGPGDVAENKHKYLAQVYAATEE